MSFAATAAAAFFTTLVVRKLLRGAVERGVKPWSCDVCMSAWLSLLWCLVAASSTWGTFDWTGWLGVLERAAAVAALTFAMLTAYQWAKMRVGWKDPDEVKPSDFQPPE